MILTRDAGLCIEDVRIAGHAQPITLRSYRPASKGKVLAVVLYFHGGAFNSGSLDDAHTAAIHIARGTPAWVLSVDYSLAPQFPFPAAPEDGYRALAWAVSNARAQWADPLRVGVAGHDAGGNLATCVAAIARDRADITLSAQALLVPLLDPSMTHVAEEKRISSGIDISHRERGYRAYLPHPALQLHPYAAPLDSVRLARLPPAFIVSTPSDRLHVEAEMYAHRLMASGVSAEVRLYPGTSRDALATSHEVLADVVTFMRSRLDGADFVPDRTAETEDR
ncbi:alpha/beta hydrolase [Paraburkholderia caffeinilytica]|uniref:alpha/beta hydrolase n=1 Tax=Paraburkholderia caffeinilytica TaxID=1761016 RepID=UPI0038BB5DF2